MKCVAGAEIPHAWLGLFCAARHHARHSGGAGAGRHEPEIQITSVLPALTLYDNVLLAFRRRRPCPACYFRERVAFCTDRVMAMLEQFRLADHADDPAAALSHGQQQGSRLPWRWRPNLKLLLLDEPTGGMSLESAGSRDELLAADQETMLAGDRRA